MEPVTDPESLRQRENVGVIGATEVLDEKGFESVRGELEDVGSHVAVGVIDEERRVLLVNNGQHGWTLTAGLVESGRDWVVAAHHGVEELTGLPSRSTTRTAPFPVVRRRT